MEKIEKIIQVLGLKPHPEGGYYRETYRSSGSIRAEALPCTFKAERSYSTCIYYMLTAGNYSSFHRIVQDEIWHFYEGSPVLLYIIRADGSLQQIIVGRDFAQGEQPQAIIPGGCWFAARVKDQDSFSLVGCTVAPGFDFADFERGKRDYLVKQFPEHRQKIEEFTR